LREKSVQDRTDGAILLAQPDHPFNLGKDLAFSEHQAVQSRSNPQEVGYGIGMVVCEEVRGQILNLEPGNPTEKTANRLYALIGMAKESIDLQTIAGAEDGSLKHLLIIPELMQGSFHALLRDTQLLPDLNGSRSVAQADNGNVHGARKGLPAWRQA
jgi:hypothetical protein